MWSSGLLMLSLFVVMLVFFTLPAGWADTSWLGFTFGGLAAALVASVTLLGYAAARLKDHGMTVARRGRHFGQAPRLPRTFGAFLLSFVAVIMMVASGELTVPAYELGSSPAHAMATTIHEDRATCAKCSTQLVVTFPVGSSVETADVLRTGNLTPADRPGLPLVYDPRHPGRVMRASDWVSGRHLDNGILPLGLALLVAIVGVSVLQIRRRRRKFGLLRPGVVVTSIQYREQRRAKSWRVTFADHTHTTYDNTPDFRTALRTKLTGQRNLSTSLGQLILSICE
jgi:hypothetical protein